MSSSSSSSSFEIVGQTFSALALGVPFLSCRSASSFALSSLFPSIQVRRGVLLVVSPCRRRHHRRRATKTKTKTTTEKKKESLSRARRDAPRPRAPRRPLHDVSSSSSHLGVGVVTASLPFSKHHNNSHKTNERACRRLESRPSLLFSLVLLRRLRRLLVLRRRLPRRNVVNGSPFLLFALFLKP